MQLVNRTLLKRVKRQLVDIASSFPIRWNDQDCTFFRVSVLDDLQLLSLASVWVLAFDWWFVWQSRILSHFVSERQEILLTFWDDACFPFTSSQLLVCLNRSWLLKLRLLCYMRWLWHMWVDDVPRLLHLVVLVLVVTALEVLILKLLKNAVDLLL